MEIGQTKIIAAVPERAKQTLAKIQKELDKESKGAWKLTAYWHESRQDYFIKIEFNGHLIKNVAARQFEPYWEVLKKSPVNKPKFKKENLYGTPALIAKVLLFGGKFAREATIAVSPTKEKLAVDRMGKPLHYFLNVHSVVLTRDTQKPEFLPLLEAGVKFKVGKENFVIKDKGSDYFIEKV